MKNWLLKFHVYGGLLCFWYLIIFGTSSLFYQHHFAFMGNQKLGDGVDNRKLALPATPSDSTLAVTLLDSLDIAGWFLPWETYRDSANIFHTQVENPKRSYQIKYDINTGATEIEKRYKGLWNIFNSLHGSEGKMPNGSWMIFWGIYTYVCLFVVLFSIVSGIWLFATSNSEKKIGWITFSSILALSLFFMIYIYYNG